MDLPFHLPSCSSGNGAVRPVWPPAAPRPQGRLLRSWEQRKWCALRQLSLRARPVAVQGQIFPLRNRNEAKWSPGLSSWEGNPSSSRTSIYLGNPGQAGPSGQRSRHPRSSCQCLMDIAARSQLLLLPCQQLFTEALLSGGTTLLWVLEDKDLA